MSAPPPHQVEPRLAPGGLVFDTWVDGHRLRRSVVLPEELRAFSIARKATADAEALLAEQSAQTGYLAVYDGDTGEGVQLLRVERD